MRSSGVRGDGAFAGLVIRGRGKFRECREVVVVEISRFRDHLSNCGPSISLNGSDRPHRITMKYVELVNVMLRPMGMRAVVSKNIAASIHPRIVGIRLCLNERIAGHRPNNREFLPEANGDTTKAMNVAREQEPTISIWGEFGAVGSGESLSNKLHHDCAMNANVVAEIVGRVSICHRTPP